MAIWHVALLRFAHAFRALGVCEHIWLRYKNFDPSCFDPIQKFGMSTWGLTLIFDPVPSTSFRPPYPYSVSLSRGICLSNKFSVNFKDSHESFKRSKNHFLGTTSVLKMNEIVANSLLRATAVITSHETNTFHQPVYVNLHISLSLVSL